MIGIHSTDHKSLVSLVVRLWTVVLTENISGRYREAINITVKRTWRTVILVRFADIMVTQRHV